MDTEEVQSIHDAMGLSQQSPKFLDIPTWDKSRAAIQEGFSGLLFWQRLTMVLTLIALLIAIFK